METEAFVKVIHGPVLVSDGRTGEAFIRSLAQRTFGMNQFLALDLLKSEAFIPTSGQRYQTVIIPGRLLSHRERNTNGIFRAGKALGFFEPPPEVAPLLREVFSEQDLRRLGLKSLVIMHKPIEKPIGYGHLLGVSSSNGVQRLRVTYASPARRWSSTQGFVFLADAPYD